MTAVLSTQPGSVPIRYQAIVRTRVIPIVEAVVTRRYVETVLPAIGLAKDLGLETKLPGPAIEVLSAAVDIASAPDAAGVQAVLDRVAAAPGGYKMKRASSKFYVRVNAYVGLTGGYETADARPSNGGLERATAFGAWVPVGVEIGRGRVGKGSLGAFFHVIDVGAVAAWRVRSAEVQSKTNVTFKQIFSPGAFIVYGWPGAPLTIGAGVSYLPELRFAQQLSGTSTEPKPLDAWRVGLSVGLDVPLFPR